MKENEVKLVIGSLLHDVGKVIYRQGDDKRKHSQSGFDYLKNEAKVEDKEILDCIRYHHADALGKASIPENSLAYIVYIADNIASAADRREKDGEDYGFEMSMPLQSIFNILNGNDKEMYYKPRVLNPKGNINYPVSEKEKFDEHFYTLVKEQLSDNLKGIIFQDEYISSLLEVLEANLTYVPSSTLKKELADISLYDHVKLTAAIASCILQYLDACNIHNYKEELYLHAKEFYQKDAFMLFSMDISGIQDFIYTIASKNALRTLRARSFYLEIMMEHCIDNILEKLNLSRANLIYSGGGHCYILAPNTENARNIIDNYLNEVNEWLVDTFQISLYVAGGYAQCSSNTLKNEPNGSFADMFHTASERISAKKAARYSVAQLIRMNTQKSDDYARECRVCRRIGKVDEDGTCPVCKALEKLSGKILYEDFFTVRSENDGESLPLPEGYYLTSDNEKSLKNRMEKDAAFVRVYGKNAMYTGKHIATKLWVGSYTVEENDFKSMAQSSQGIPRIGILRADVDNLGQTFVAGFENEKNHNKYVTLSRTATLSRQLSLFFKLYLNHILEKKKYQATIVYSGGDDLFIVGAWNDIITLSIDIKNEFKKYTENTLTLSAGIGIYTSGYPISAIAGEVADMEDMSKKKSGKNAVTIFEDGVYHDEIENDNIIKISDGTYTWSEFENEVIEEKYKLLEEFFSTSEDRGKAFLYRILELIRNRKEKINFARYLYLIARLEPDNSTSEMQKANYKKFSTNMFRWIQSEKDCRQLKTAINMYAYMTRKEG